MVAIPFATSDNNGAFDWKQENHCVIVMAASGTPGRGGQEGNTSSSSKEAENSGPFTTQGYCAVATISVTTSKNSEVFMTTRKLLG